MVQKWAPLVWLAPGEKFFPIEVTHFLRYVTVPSKDGEFQTLPIGPKSEQMFLVTKSNIGKSNQTKLLLLFALVHLKGHLLKILYFSNIETVTIEPHKFNCVI